MYANKKRKWLFVNIVVLAAALGAVIGILYYLGGERHTSQVSNGTASPGSSQQQQNTPQYYPGGPDEWVPTPSMRSALEAREGKVLFYGRVIDQDDQPVAGAVAHVSVHSWKDGAQRLEFRADQDGRFTVEAPSADSMSIRELSCDGYSMPPDRRYGTWGFYFGASQTYQPDPRNPVVYRLSKRKGNLQPMIHCGVFRTYRPKGEKFGAWFIRQEGNPLQDDLWFSLERAPDKSIRSGFTWTFKVGVDEGGIQRADMTRPSWEAPADGYFPLLEWSGQPTGVSKIDEWVFVKLRNGKYYARLNVRMSVATDNTENPEAMIGIEGVYGLHGGRWLELVSGLNSNEFRADPRGMDAARGYDSEKMVPSPPPRKPSQSRVDPGSGATTKSVGVHLSDARSGRSVDLKVTDQHGQAVDGVDILIYPGGNISPEYPPPAESLLRCRTDSQGRATVDSIAARTLTLIAVQKEGYVLGPSVDPSWAFRPYPPLLDRDTPGAPVMASTLRLWRIGDSKPTPVVRILRSVMPRPDNEPYKLNLLDPSVEQNQQGSIFGLSRNHDGTLDAVGMATARRIPRDDVFVHDFRIFLKVLPKKWDARSLPIAQCRIEVVDGGLISTTDEFMYEAPADGYLPAAEWAVMADDPRDKVRKFFVRTRGGKLFGALQVRADNFGGESPTYHVSYWLNPKGERNLVPGKFYESYAAYQVGEGDNQ